uniref:Uncharacterized protein n=1 Tax=Triticum urartu TaxID=4572 RepID=A0A8R7PS03_TRIUA
MHRGIRDTSANYKLWLEYRNGEREKEEGKEAAAAVRDPLDTLLVASSPLTYSWQRFNVCTAQPSPYAVHGWAGRLGGLLTSANGGDAAAGDRRRRVHAGRHDGPLRQPGHPIQLRRLESLLLRSCVRGVRADGALWYRVQPGAVPDEGAAPGHGALRQQRHQLGRHQPHHARPRRLHRRRPPRTLPHLHGRLRHLPSRNVPADHGRVAAVAEAAGVRHRHGGPELRAQGVEPAAGRVLSGPVHPRRRHRRHQAQHLHHRRRPVRQARAAGAPAEALLLQLVDVQHLPGHALRQHRPRLHPGQDRLDRRLRAPHHRPRRLHRRVHRRNAPVPPQADLTRELPRQDGRGHRRRRPQVPRPGARGPARPARARPRALRQEKDVPAAPHAEFQCAEQSGGEDRDREHVAVVAEHGDAGGGDEADAQDASRAVHHVRAERDAGPDQHAVREAGHDAGAARRRLRHPAGEPAGVRDRLHARLRRALRPPLRALHAAPDKEPAGHLAAPADGRRARPPHRDHDGRVGDRAAPPGRGARERRARQQGHDGPALHLRAAPAVPVHGRRRRLPGGGQDRVLLRPGARGDEEPRHVLRHDQPRRRQLPQQLPAVDGVARHAAARRRTWRLDPEQPQRLAAGPLLRLLRRAQLRQPPRLLRRVPDVRV